MHTRSLLAVVAAVSVCSSFFAACDCSSSSSTDNNTPDGGGSLEASVTPGDDGGVIDSGGDAAACNKHLPSGFSQALASGGDENFGEYVSMALDENDDPMLAYFAVKASVDGNAAPGACTPPTTSVGCQAVYFTRWDPCTGAFVTPVVVDPVTNVYAPTRAQQVTIAYDASTKEIGIAYQKTLPIDPSFFNGFRAIFLATRKAGQTAFSTQQVTNNSAADGYDTEVPALAMANGKLFMAFTTGTGEPAPCPANHTCLQFLSSPPANAPDAGADAGTSPHAFDYSLVPSSVGFGGFAIPRSISIALAVDSTGKPGLAYLEEPETGYNLALHFWRPGMTDSVKVADTNNVQNDDGTVNLAFVGTKPRVAGLLTADPETYAIVYASSPDDGTTWNAPVPLLTSGGAGFFTSLAASATGEAISSHHNSSASAASVAAGCTTDPIVVRSTNGGVSFSGCSLPSDVNLNGALSSAFGTSRLTGKLVLVGHSKDSLADGGAGHGIVYYQDP